MIHVNLHPLHEACVSIFYQLGLRYAAFLLLIHSWLEHHAPLHLRILSRLRHANVDERRAVLRSFHALALRPWIELEWVIMDLQIIIWLDIELEHILRLCIFIFVRRITKLRRHE